MTPRTCSPFPGVLIVVLIGIIMAVVLIAVASQRVVPQFSVGQCIQATLEREEWETPWSIHKILQVGKQAYRTRAYPADVPSDVSFWSVGYFKEVPCP